MPKRPQVALKVNDLAASQAFYVEHLGFELAESQADADLAVVIDTDGDRILLAGPAVEEVMSLLDEPRIVFKPGDTLDYAEDDLAARFAVLTERGLTDIHEEQADDDVH